MQEYTDEFDIAVDRRKLRDRRGEFGPDHSAPCTQLTVFSGILAEVQRDVEKLQLLEHKVVEMTQRLNYIEKTSESMEEQVDRLVAFQHKAIAYVSALGAIAMFLLDTFKSKLGL